MHPDTLESPTEAPAESAPQVTGVDWHSLSPEAKIDELYAMQCRLAEAINQIGQMTQFLCEGTAGVFEAVEHLKSQNFSPASLLKMAMGGKS